MVRVTAGAHPRSRGEHPILVLISSRRAGSSPLARGTLSIDDVLDGAPRLIPARAGNTVSDYPRKRHVRAHPRSRGEHSSSALRLDMSGGSSPLARGTLTTWLHAFNFAGLIPARAGNTVFVHEAESHTGAHPRSRGEHASRAALHRVSVGSSPLARGTPRSYRRPWSG